MLHRFDGCRFDDYEPCMSSVYIVMDERCRIIGSDCQLRTAMILSCIGQIPRFQNPTDNRHFIIRLFTLRRSRQGFLEWWRRCVIRFTAEVGAVLVKDEW